MGRGNSRHLGPLTYRGGLDAWVLQDAHGGAVTVSNVSVLAQRSADGLALTCEAFNSALRLSRAASLVLAITCEGQGQRGQRGGGSWES